MPHCQPRLPTLSMGKSQREAVARGLWHPGGSLGPGLSQRKPLLVGAVPFAPVRSLSKPISSAPALGTVPAAPACHQLSVLSLHKANRGLVMDAAVVRMGGRMPLACPGHLPPCRDWTMAPV